jgi:hypothetical protein
MTTAIAVQTPFAPQGIEQAMSLATTLAKSSLLPEALRNKPADVLVVLITGHELGLSPMQAVRGLYVVNGKAVMSADMMVALVLQHRAVCEYFRLEQSSDQSATYITKRAGSEPVKLTWTMAQASAAGLSGKGTWKAHPAAMLRARCASALARAVYPDLVLGVYNDDEAQDFVPAARPVAPPLQVVSPVVEVATSSTPAAGAPDIIEGEVIEAGDVALDIIAKINACGTKAQLVALIPEIKALPSDAIASVRAVYGEKQKGLAS